MQPASPNTDPAPLSLELRASTLESLARRSLLKVESLSPFARHGSMGKVNELRFWEGVELIIRDCLRNPFLLESNEHTIAGAFGSAAFERCLLERSNAPLATEGGAQ